MLSNCVGVSFCLCWVSPHSVDDGIYFALACALARCCAGHSWLACRCGLVRWAAAHETRDGWPGDSGHSLCWAESSLDWPGMDRARQGWNKQWSEIESVCITGQPVSSFWFIEISFRYTLPLKACLSSSPLHIHSAAHVLSLLLARTTRVVSFWPLIYWANISSKNIMKWAASLKQVLWTQTHEHCISFIMN